MVVGQPIMTGSEAPIKSGNALPIRNIPVGTTICCVEMMPGKGAQLARSAGTSVQLLAREGIYAQIRLRSGEVRRVHVECRATIGEVGNEENNLRKIGKAGANALARYSPDGSWCAMNPLITRTVVVKVVLAKVAFRLIRGVSPPRVTVPAAISARTA
jgi:large subunit ribosomal protein L2